jgi:hypothetical protein
MARPRRGPAERLLPEPDGVLQVEPADVRPPRQVQVQLQALGAGPPQPQHLRRTGHGGDALDPDADDGAAHDRPGSRVPWPGWRCCLGCSPLHAVTVTLPSWSSLVARVAVGAGQVAGSAKLNLAPWRRGRPVAPGGRGGGSASKQRSDRSRTSTTMADRRGRGTAGRSRSRRRTPPAAPARRRAAAQAARGPGRRPAGRCRPRGAAAPRRPERSRSRGRSRAGRSTGRPSRR